ncbi:MAG: ParB/RepB/Spo0J family partition protein [Verrucomicrobia bacterium]|nr:ParB/RepB/Spo0J family partition protein [Verrucomicrobiota bacterium]
MAAKVVLGRGLGSLIQAKTPAATMLAPQPGERVQQTPLDEIVASPLQPRKDFRNEALTELVESIRERGIIQPLIVRRVGKTFELIAGERRWRAAKQIGLATVPTILREATDQQVLELALIENLQRADLSVVEEARAYHRLAHEFGLKQEDIAKKVGKNRATVANAMRLLDLDGQVQGWLTQERISVGHAKVLLAVKNPEEQRALAEQLIRQGSTVRSAEKLIATHLARASAAGTGGQENGGPGSRRAAGGARLGEGSDENGGALPPALRQVETRLRERLQTHVALRHGEKKGTLEIEYYGTDDLQRILDLLGFGEE